MAPQITRLLFETILRTPVRGQVTHGYFSKHLFHPDDPSYTQVVFRVVQATSPLGSHVFGVEHESPVTQGAHGRVYTRVSRRVRRRLGIGLAVVSLTGLSVGGAISSAAAEVHAKRVGRSFTPNLNPTPTNGALTDLNVQQTNQAAAGSQPAADGAPPLKTTTSTATWSVMVGGDSLMTRPGISTSPFDGQSPSMRSADLAIVNVETAISDSTTKVPKQYNFKSPVKFAEYMADAGIDVGSLANNHSMDFGDQGMIDTVDALREAGVDSVGAGVNRKAALKPSTHMIKGLQVAVIGASQVIPDPSWIATDNSIGVAAAGKDLTDEDTTMLVNEIRTARQSSDVVIVILHWGVEKAVCPTDLQQRTAALLHSAGATLVVGAHPHVLQPVVRSGQDLTAYSLGNFVWDPRSGLAGDTGILEVTFTGATISGATFHPHRLDGRGWAAPADGAGNRERILKQVQRNCPGADGTNSVTP